MLVSAIPGFEFPRHDLYDFEIKTIIINEEDAQESDFIIGVVWDELSEAMAPPRVIIERSTFNCDLTSEEINILAILMMNEWLQR